MSVVASPRSCSSDARPQMRDRAMCVYPCIAASPPLLSRQLVHSCPSAFSPRPSQRVGHGWKGFGDDDVHVFILLFCWRLNDFKLKKKIQARRMLTASRKIVCDLLSACIQPHVRCSRCANQRLLCAVASMSRIFGNSVVRDRDYPVVRFRGCGERLRCGCGYFSCNVQGQLQAHIGRCGAGRERENRLRLSCRGGAGCGAFLGGSAAAPFFCARVQRASTTEHFLHSPSLLRLSP